MKDDMLKISASLFVALAFLGGCTTNDGKDEPPATTTTLIETTTTALVPEVQANAVSIIAAFQSAGLDVPNPRDNTDGNCGDKGMACTLLMTTDILSIHEWTTPAEADAFVAVSEKYFEVSRVTPLVTIRWMEGGSTPAYDRAAYKAVLDGLN